MYIFVKFCEHTDSKMRNSFGQRNGKFFSTNNWFQGKMRPNLEFRENGVQNLWRKFALKMSKNPQIGIFANSPVGLWVKVQLVGLGGL